MNIELIILKLFDMITITIPPTLTVALSIGVINKNIKYINIY